jgi:folate-binding protein YgfZ
VLCAPKSTNTAETEVGIVYKVIIVSGDDAKEFLQGQLTQDIARLDDGNCLPAAWCNAQGRVVMTMTITVIGGGFALVVPQDIAATAVARLGMYRFRAKVDFTLAESAWQVFATSITEAQAKALPDTIRVSALAASGSVAEIIAPSDALGQVPPGTFATLDDPAWKTARIMAGRVDIHSANSASYTPHMLNLDLTGAVSFSKGCYIGQEIVARTEHRGRSKRRTFRYQCTVDNLVVGDVLRNGTNDVGVVVNASGFELLAVVPVDATQQSLAIRGVTAKPQALPYSVS